MKKYFPAITLLLVFIAELTVLFRFALRDTQNRQDAVLVNEVLHSVQDDWKGMESHSHRNQTSLDYTVLSADGTVLFQTRRGISENLNMAIIHRDTILDICFDDSVVGKLIIYNNSAEVFRSEKKTVIAVLAVIILVQTGICAGYMLYLNHTIIKPFGNLKGFAERIAEGNLDVPLEMDRKNLFGAFTESFDIMRWELQKARKAQAQANAEKKELVARLSHDIKTPVASIKAASEVGAALAESEKTRENYRQIIRKADQINTLVTDLFTATLEELRQLPVVPGDMDSRELKTLLENADYLHLGEIPEIPDCLIYADKLRLQQVFDNIFANSYKYAGTPISLSAALADGHCAVCVEDCGGGVGREELPGLKEKFRRGSNAKNVDGAGLGLYISDYFLKEMHGELIVENGEKGLKVTVKIALSGTI